MRELSVFPDGERIAFSLRRTEHNVKGVVMARSFRFDAEAGRRITMFGSDFVMSPLLRASELHVGCMRVQPGGCVGYHLATTPQLFAVVDGAGWIRSGESEERQRISAGGAVIWESGEWHEVGTDEGLIAIVVEGTQVGEGREPSSA